MAGEWKLINETVDAQCETIAGMYDNDAKRYWTLAKEWADKGVSAYNYVNAQRCCIHAESLDKVASDLRGPKVARQIREKEERSKNGVDNVP